MKTHFYLVTLGLLLTESGVCGEGTTIHVKASDSLGPLRDALATNPAIQEVIFESGTYFGGLFIERPKSSDFARQPLLVRAADGAKVVFDGARPVEDFQAHEHFPGVFWIHYTSRGGEYPKLWESQTRTRYTLAADSAAVAHFPGTFSFENKRLLFHTSDGKAPKRGHVLMSVHDCGLFINRPFVTVRGLAFQNFLAREKWSTGIDLRVNDITVEDCRANNCSLGFVVTGHNNTVRRCAAEDVGGGVYVGGENARVEDCRLLKRRDRFMVPMYAQDDTGIQYYSPARGGIVRGNLCEGFGMGVFIKANNAPYVVEHNTLVGLGQGLGFGATSWHPQQRFRYNIIADCDRMVQIYLPNEDPTRDIDYNCYWFSARKDVKKIGARDLVADPKFVWPQGADYRLENTSPCAKLADASGPCGAFGLIGDAPLHPGPTREWHVSNSGRDGLEGSAEHPVRTIQFAVDRARPGDTIIIHPGIYPDPVRIARGGTKERPLVIRAAEKWQAILDSNRAASEMIAINRAQHVHLEGLEIRWYGQAAIDLQESPNVTVIGCKIWNAHWEGAWPTGYAIRVVRSPGFVGRRNVLFRQEHGFWLYNSPKATVTHNTCVASLYAAAAFLYSCENSICRNNSFPFQGNDVLVIEENLGEKHKLKAFDCDHNNYGTALRQQPPGATFDSIKPRASEGYLSGGSKAIVNYNEYKGEMKRFVSLAEWREFSGLDRHTIFADPLHRDSAGRDFRLDPKSPNRGAGAGGDTIGAFGD